MTDLKDLIPNYPDVQQIALHLRQSLSKVDHNDPRLAAQLTDTITIAGATKAVMSGLEALFGTAESPAGVDGMHTSSSGLF